MSATQISQGLAVARSTDGDGRREVHSCQSTGSENHCARRKGVKFSRSEAECDSADAGISLNGQRSHEPLFECRNLKTLKLFIKHVENDMAGAVIGVAASTPAIRSKSTTIDASIFVAIKRYAHLFEP